MSRRTLALGGVALSLAVSVLAWVYLHTLLVFLVVPVVPFLARERAPVRECPTCGFRTRRDYAFCPRDGSELE